MSVQTLYQQKRMSAADAMGLVKNGDTIVIPTAVGEPPALLTALSDARRSLRGVQVAQILPVRKYGYFDPETTEHVRHSAYFFSNSDHKKLIHGGVIRRRNAFGRLFQRLW